MINEVRLANKTLDNYIRERDVPGIIRLYTFMMDAYKDQMTDEDKKQIRLKVEGNFMKILVNTPEELKNIRQSPAFKDFAEEWEHSADTETFSVFLTNNSTPKSSYPSVDVDPETARHLSQRPATPSLPKEFTEKKSTCCISM